MALALVLVTLAVVIPSGTVLVEELVFRGVVLGLLRRLASPWGAVAWASVVFGLWHVVPAWRAQADNALLGQTSRGLTVLGTFLATAAAGVFFCWLRQRSGSLAAPALAHVGTNSIPLVVAWFATR